MEKNYLVIRSDLSEESYKRLAYINIARDKRTPEDIFDADFQTPSLDYTRAVVLNSKVDINYTATVITTSKVGNEKVETSTPIAGQYSDENYGYSYDEEDEVNTKYTLQTYKKEESLVEFIHSVPETSIIKAETADFPIPPFKEPLPRAVERAKYDCQRNAEVACRAKITGKIEAFHANTKVTIKKMKSVAIPTYNMNYVYKDKTYKHSMFAAGNHMTTSVCPDISSEVSKSSNIKKLFIANIALSALSTIISIATSKFWLAFIFFLFASIAFGSKLFFKHKLSSLIYGKNLKAKKEALAIIFEKLNFEPFKDSDFEYKKGERKPFLEFLGLHDSSKEGLKDFYATFIPYGAAFISIFIYHFGPFFYVFGITSFIVGIFYLIKFFKKRKAKKEKESTSENE